MVGHSDSYSAKPNELVGNSSSEAAAAAVSSENSSFLQNQVKFSANGDEKLYLSTDNGPFFVHLVSEDQEDNYVHDTIIGLSLKKLQVKGVREIKKINRRELKIIFIDRAAANNFLISSVPNELNVRAFIPKYVIQKVGIIFDIPTQYNEQLMDCIDSDCPIISVYRCQKRRIIDSKKTKDWIPANTVKLTFRCQVLPDEISFGYSKGKVKPFVPNVTQCYKCLRFGHVSKFCKQANGNCINCGV